mmetsp:Transcript_29335/g.65678  ORF Transcript_29335/g.65678 Transcript_29335/m.65678 type:complete len:502 (-) Transcript_29335:115-1620(-)
MEHLRIGSPVKFNVGRSTESGEEVSLPESFALKLFELVSDGRGDIIGFDTPGTSFEVRDPVRLESELLPTLYMRGGASLENFVQDLNLHDFKRLSEQEWVFSHDLFRRDEPTLLSSLKPDGAESSPLIRRTHSSTSSLCSSRDGSGHGSGHGEQVGQPLKRSKSDSRLTRRSVKVGSVWRALVDKSTGAEYFWNTFTGHIQWEAPPDIELVQRDKQNGFANDSDGDTDGDVSDGSPRIGPLGNPTDATGKRLRVPSLACGLGHSNQIGSSGSSEGSGDEGDTGQGAANKRQRSPIGSARKTSGDFGGDSGSACETDGDGSSDAGPDGRVAPMVDDDDAAAQACFDRLQVSAAVLVGLQRALYMQGVGPALVALVTLGMRTNPYQDSATLQCVVHEKLSSHKELRDELRSYREALEPSSGCLHQESQAGMGGTGEDTMYVRHPLARADDGKGETYSMREFMAFVVNRLEMLSDQCDGKLGASHETLLRSCLRLWWNHASRFQ